jgi:hypothetical protein
MKEGSPMKQKNRNLFIPAVVNENNLIQHYWITEEEQRVILEYRKADTPIKQAIHRILDPPDTLNK